MEVTSLRKEREQLRENAMKELQQTAQNQSIEQDRNTALTFNGKLQKMKEKVEQKLSLMQLNVQRSI